ncbi:hypothetical protein SIN09_38180, partial [Streptomyces sp. F8]|nr:hypothetical protein [Streptomyces sp. F8]
VAVAGVARPELEAGWAVVAHLLVGLPLLAAVRVPALPEAVRRGSVLAGAVVGALGALAAGAAVLPVLMAGLRVLEEVWAATTPAAPAHGPGAAAAVALLMAAGAAWWLSRVSARPEAGVSAVV